CGQPASFIAETIQGVGGTVTPPLEYFQIVYEIVRRYGGLCIADEVQTGFGRTGAHYWGFENWGVTPDIVTMAKGIGNGAPLAACGTRAGIHNTRTHRRHFNIFRRNALARPTPDPKSTRLNSSHFGISYTHLFVEKK